jgi:branched-chain amino acid transport system substrate-binding protein
MRMLHARSALLLALIIAPLIAATPLAAQEPIKIGFGVSLTGGLASSGKAHLLSKQIWAEEINARGGVLGRPIKLVYYDDQTNAATVPGIYAKLIDVDKVDLLMGAATNLIVAAMPLIMERNRMVMVLLALGSNAEFRYPRYFQNSPFGPDPKGVLSTIRSAWCVPRPKRGSGPSCSAAPWWACNMPRSSRSSARRPIAS